MGLKLERIAAAAALLLGTFLTAVGQTVVPSPSPIPAAPATPALSTTEAKVKRWFEFDQLTIATRYNFAENANKHKTANNVQYQFISKFRFKFDAKGRYSVVGHIGTGPSITSS